MRKFIAAAALAGLIALPTAANAASERTVTGAAIGAGAGAVVAGPPGAVVGGVAGAVIGGPKITRSKTCWRDSRGVRHCRYR